MGDHSQALSLRLFGLPSPPRAWAWGLGFGLLFFAAFWLNDQFADWFIVVHNRISAVFLPAFVKVLAVMVAGGAGALGIFIGSLASGLFITHDPVSLALWHAGLSTTGVLVAVHLMRWGLRLDVLPMTLPMLLAVAVLASVTNAVLHGLFWSHWDEHVQDIDEIALMIFGDLTGVAVGFLLLRAAVLAMKKALAWRASSIPNDPLN
jgi:hypothetical protein